MGRHRIRRIYIFDHGNIINNAIKINYLKDL